eukprot:TRINITY_DN3167_c0_g1_i1.p1 TRINITY_DN3167_c0_g1~~TRINITY_DN3167_c0_g1_i1.p1  ORF type:complete len:497 (-),score=185.88 TRINITY_DN3167_c0_g1_i1:543-2033(-)
MEEEFLEYHSTNLWRSLYTQICIESRNNEFTAVEALKPENKQLNRYRDVYPYDHSRVPLSNVPTTDYINASLVVADTVSRKYILTQGPLAGTTPHFWSLVWEQQSKAVIMLNRVMEKGTLKCHQYWPTIKGELVTCEEVGLVVENIEMSPGQHYNISTLRITNTATSETRDVLHFHYTTWPDFECPSCPDTFLEFLGAVRESGSLDSGVGPALVHCSAGIGRSGTFILVDTCLLEAENSGPEVVCIKQRLLDMRTFRMGLIQTHDQLKFSYQAIIEGARQLGLINSVPTFETPVVEASDSSSEEDVPPPLPPPRTESLKKGSSQEEEEVVVAKSEVVQLQDREVTITDSEPFNSTEQFNNIPAILETKMVNGNAMLEEEDSLTTCMSVTTSNSSSVEHSPNKCILSDSKMLERKRYVRSVRPREDGQDSEGELRKRKNEEKNTTEEKLKEVEKAIQKADDWKKKMELWQDKVYPFCVGLAIFAAGTYFYFREEVED